MIKCKNDCPVGLFNGCCFFCEIKDCKERCTENPSDCGNAIKVDDVLQEQDEEKALETFKTGQVAILQGVANIIKQKKELEQQEADLKVKLQEAMELYGIKKFTSDILNITYVAESTSTSIDSTKLKKKYPDIAAECSKTSNKKAYIRVSIKDEK